MTDKRKWLEYDDDPKSHWVAHPVKSFERNPDFTHAIFCPGCECGHGWTAGWTFNGNLDKPTISPSLLVNWVRGDGVAVRCHSFINDGMIQFLDDSTHALRGQSVALEQF
jgi:hypothetical protein